MSVTADLQSRVRDEIDAALDTMRGRRALVALSGGLDSTALLHAARFATGSGYELVAAHLDHAMRPESVRDAQWATGLCRAWGVPVHVERLAAVPRSEEEARDARYAFLERVRAAADADVIVTGHHADDQAETVLFRVARGTGLTGLAGMPRFDGRRVGRPLLDVWRHDLENYARATGLRWRDDASNRDAGFARNALRQSVLPALEASVAGSARASLVRLSALARENEAAWASVLPELMVPLSVRAAEDGRGSWTVGWSHDAFQALPAPVHARVLRALAGDAGLRLDRRATEIALRFLEAAGSGASVDLGGGLRLFRELERSVIAASPEPTQDRPLFIPTPGEGSGEARVGGHTVTVHWGSEQDSARGEAFDPASLSFPLIVRGREPGDRIRLPGGTRKIKKVLLDARVPPTRRPELPVLADGTGQILWVPGIARASSPGDSRAVRRTGDASRIWRIDIS